MGQASRKARVGLNWLGGSHQVTVQWVHPLQDCWTQRAGLPTGTPPKDQSWSSVWPAWNTDLQVSLEGQRKPRGDCGQGSLRELFM